YQMIYGNSHPRHQHSFPPRRSSDLALATHWPAAARPALTRLARFAISGFDSRYLVAGFNRWRGFNHSGGFGFDPLGPCRPFAARSQEHTSELLSRENLVCRLPLEKK